MVCLVHAGVLLRDTDNSTSFFNVFAIIHPRSAMISNFSISPLSWYCAETSTSIFEKRARIKTMLGFLPCDLPDGSCSLALSAWTSGTEASAVKVSARRSFFMVSLLSGICFWGEVQRTARLVPSNSLRARLITRTRYLPPELNPVW